MIILGGSIIFVRIMQRLLAVWMVALFVVNPLKPVLTHSQYLSPKSFVLEKISEKSTQAQEEKEKIIKGIITTVLIAIIVGAVPYFVKVLSHQGHNQFHIIASYYFYNTLIVFLFDRYLSFGEKRSNKKVKNLSSEKKRFFESVLFLVLTEIIVGKILAVPGKIIAISYSDGITPDAIVRMAPLILVFLAVPTLKEKLSLKKFLGVLLILIGVISLVLVKKSGVMGETTLIGTVIAVLATFCYVISDIVNKKIMQTEEISERKFLLYAFGAGFVFYSLLSFLGGHSLFPIFSIHVIFISLCTMSGAFGKLFGMKYLEATLVRSILSTSPLFTLLWIALLNQELPRPFGFLVIALSLISVGLYLVVSQHNQDMKQLKKEKNREEKNQAPVFLSQMTTINCSL